MARILVFGDSIVYGAWDREKEGGWVHRLRKFLDEKHFIEPDFDYAVYNLGVSGNTIGELLERFEFETKGRVEEDEEMIIIFQIGINDSQFVISQNGLRTSSEKFRENVEKLINQAQKFTSKIVFVGLTPVDESKTTPIPWNPDKIYKNENIKMKNEIIKSVCRKNNIYFIEIFEKWIKSDYKKLIEDGLHPNSAGHKKIFEAVKDFLIQEKIIKL
jgi:lysophospholipase L1-like esterase